MEDPKTLTDRLREILTHLEERNYGKAESAARTLLSKSIKDKL